MNTAVLYLFCFLLRATNSAEVSYIPVSDNQGIYSVAYNNVTGSRFSLQILDENGNQLYQGVYTDKDFRQRFRLAEPDNYTKLVFVIRNLGDHSYQRFEVDASTHLVEDVDVKALN